MNKKSAKYVLYLLVIIVVLFFCSIALIMLFKNNDNKNVNSKDVSYIADTNTIIIKNIVSVSEVFGKNIDEENGGAFGYLNFEVKNNTSEDRDFQIFITKQSIATDEINSSYITFYLTDSNNEPFELYTGNKLPSYNEFSVIEDKPDSRDIYDGTIKANETRKFILRVWIADNYVVASDKEASFSFEIDARAI